MITLIFFAGVALIFGIMFDAMESLPYLLVVVSVLAISAATLLILNAGPTVPLVALALTGILGLLTTWDKLFAI